MEIPKQPKKKERASVFKCLNGNITIYLREVLRMLMNPHIQVIYLK